LPPSMTSPCVDIVVLTWNDGIVLAEALRSGLDSSGVVVSMVVVDNGSDPPAAVPDDPRVRLLRNAANRGVAAARNQGALAGSAPFLCLLDSDAHLEAGALRAMVDVLVADERVAVVGPVFAGQAPEASAGQAPTVRTKLARVLDLRSTYRSTHSSERSGPAWDVDFCIGACQVIRRRAWEAVGGLDESYFYGPEDVDFCLRLRETGWRVVQTAAAAVHHPPRRRNKGVLTRRGMQHAWAVARHQWRHRRFAQRVDR
jgi:GT2 family glycosyltransferase